MKNPPNSGILCRFPASAGGLFYGCLLDWRKVTGILV